MAPALNATWAAMGRSLGLSSSASEDAILFANLEKLRNRVVLMIGDSSVAQPIHPAGAGRPLATARHMPVAKAVSTGAHRRIGDTSRFRGPDSAAGPDRPDSSNRVTNFSFDRNKSLRVGRIKTGTIICRLL